ncbi:LacI family DNA-binding transcriptional regulator [Bordetella sp. N]|uniref:LacI family DNA-binding transcriptional regulator n=1 Tax=Bordetella sp. N TaxID=1746199 RepID=UPI00070AB280|nr:LacI family DNA-binding transcriptional regulator [Bordetella sp. N]ALM84079.1 LacI family transcriptional regulator [Bordetella sp. N]
MTPKTRAARTTVKIVDVAKAANVSPAIVSRILSNDAKLVVRDDTRQRVQEAIEALGYTPNPQARGLRLSRSNTLAMIVPEINSPVFPVIIQGAQRAAWEHGYSLLVGGMGGEEEDPQVAGRLLRSNRIDGLLVTTGRHEEQMLQELATLNAPFVLVNRYLDEDHPYVALDERGAAAAITRHLTELGHRRIAFLGGLQRRVGERRVAGYADALAEAGLPWAPELVVEAGYYKHGGESGLRQLLALDDPPTAVLATNEIVAAGAMAVAHAEGIRIPKDMSLASFSDGMVAELLSPSLTAVRFPLERVGYEATTMLVAIVEGRSLPQTRISLPHDEVILRHSTGAAPRRRRARP